MRRLHDSAVPRHARMFELLRQAHQAELTSERLSQVPPRVASRQNVQDWQARAIQSLQRPQDSLRA